MKKVVKIIAIISVILVIVLITMKIGRLKNQVNGNVSNMGLALEHRGTTYYNKYEKGIFAFKGDTETQLTDETAYSLTFYEDKIYYMTIEDFNQVVIKYVDIKNGNVKSVATIYTSISKFFIEDESIFYFTNHGENGICKMDLNGENETIIVAGNIQDFQVDQKEIFYINEANEICKVHLKRSKNIVLSQIAKAKKMQVVEGWIYYYNEFENALFRVSKNGKKVELVSVLVNHEIYNVCGKYVYYYDKNTSKIARMQLKKSNKCENIVDIAVSKTRINVAGDVLYYLDQSKDESQNYQIYRIKINGEKMQDIEYER